MRSNFDELKYVLNKKKPVICLLSETHITEDMDINDFYIDGFNCVCCNSYSSHTGGVVAYINNKIKISEVNILNSQLLWCLSFKIRTQNMDLVVAGVYLSASENKNNILDSFGPWLENVANGNSIMCCGDLNIDLNVDNQFSRRLNNILDDNGLKQLVNVPTRVTEETSTRIDLCISNLCRNRISCVITDDDQISDHKNIEVKIIGKLIKLPSRRKSICVWNNYDPVKLWDSIEQWLPQWRELQNKSVDDKMNWLLLNLKNSIEQFRVTKQLIDKSDFFDRELEVMRIEKNRLYKIAQYTRYNDDWITYKRYKNQYKDKIQLKKYERTQKLLDKVNGDIKGTWKVLKSLLNNENAEISSLNNGQITIEDNKQMADEFNKFFVSSIEEINECIPLVPYTSTTTDTPNDFFEFEAVSIHDVKMCLSELKNNTDEYNLNVNVLLDCLELIAVQLTDIINDSFQSGCFPNALKIATIIPIRKVAGTTSINEFRPVNMLPLIEKVIEKLAYRQFNSFITRNALLNEYQSGFRGSHSCESAINDVLFEWKEAQNTSKSIIAVFLDLQRAFETIDPKILIKKLRQYGVREKSLEWFNSYLSNRKQKVKLNNTHSCELNNNLGVPQGSILGPLLFILYINDLGNCLRYCRIKMFADDTLIFIICDSVIDACQLLNDDLSILFDKLCMHKLKLNVKKTKAMIISNRRSTDISDIVIKIKQEKIDLVDQIKYLGVVIDKKLNFTENVNYLCKKVGKKVNVLSRLRNQLNCQQKIMLYKTLIQPHFTYCSSILFLSNQNDLRRMQVMQNRCMRNILRLDRFSHEKDMLDTLNLLSVSHLIKFNTLIFVNKIVNGRAPSYLTNRVKKNSENERKNTLRNRNNIELINATKMCSQNSLYYKGFALYNSLPNGIKDEKSVYKFKSLLREHVRQNL